MFAFPAVQILTCAVLNPATLVFLLLRPWNLAGDKSSAVAVVLTAVEVLPAFRFSNVYGILQLLVYHAAGVPAIAFTLAVACVPIAPMAPLLKASYQRLLHIVNCMYI